MNKRIRALMEEAMEWVPNQIDPDTKIRLLNAEKFAELIVRECATLTLDHRSDDYYQGWLDYRDEIRRYFRVEQ
jgi:hypothetical protein